VHGRDAAVQSPDLRTLAQGLRGSVAVGGARGLTLIPVATFPHGPRTADAADANFNGEIPTPAPPAGRPAAAMRSRPRAGTGVRIPTPAPPGADPATAAQAGPQVRDDYVTVRAGTTATLDVLRNDLPAAGMVLRIIGVTRARNGSVAIGAKGTQLRYTPHDGFLGTETLLYTVADNDDETASGVVTLVVVDGKAPVPPPTATGIPLTPLAELGEGIRPAIAEGPDADPNLGVVPIDARPGDKLGRIAGVVRDATGDAPAGLAGETMVLDRQQRGVFTPVRTATTDSHGAYEFPGLTPGVYRVRHQPSPGRARAARTSASHIIQLDAGMEAVDQSFSTMKKILPQRRPH
jgi:hypothetical protein